MKYKIVYYVIDLDAEREVYHEDKNEVIEVTNELELWKELRKRLEEKAKELEKESYYCEILKYGNMVYAKNGKTYLAGYDIEEM